MKQACTMFGPRMKKNERAQTPPFYDQVSGTEDEEEESSPETPAASREPSPDPGRLVIVEEVGEDDEGPSAPQVAEDVPMEDVSGEANEDAGE